MVTSVAAGRDPATGLPEPALDRDGSNAAPGAEPLCTMDVQLPTAAVNLLFVLCAASARGRRWLASRAGGEVLLVRGVLPLAFHSLLTVRRAVARLLAAVCLGGQADGWSGWEATAAAAAAPETTDDRGGEAPRAGDAQLRLPAPFKPGFVLPCRATWVPLPRLAAAPSTRELADAAGRRPRLQGAALEGPTSRAVSVPASDAVSSAGRPEYGHAWQ